MLELNGSGTRTGERLTEKQVVHIWQRQLLESVGLSTEDGLPLEVLYPGRVNDDRGADFRDAVISTNRHLRCGDVEIHVRSSDWHSHGHDRDAAYNRVILHVVLRHDRPGKTRLESGAQVPVLALEKHLSAASTGPPCAGASLTRIIAFVDKAGETRFLARAGKFHSRLQQTTAAQVLYEGMMESLGFAKNKAPFLELARRVPFSELELIANGSSPNEDCILQLQRRFLGEADRVRGWNTFKIRPGNSPSRRLMAMARLLVRFRESGLLEGLAGKVMSTNFRNERNVFRALENTLIVSTGNRQGNSFTLLGPERAADIIINVLLPFCHALGSKTNIAGLTRKAVKFYRRYPAGTPNSLVNHMLGQFRLGPKNVDTAKRQQGLLHVYKELCIQGRCSECPLG